MNYNDTLFTLCNMNNLGMVKYLLSMYNEKEDTLDVLQEDGILFRASLSRNSHEICAALLDFFETKQNPSE